MGRAFFMVGLRGGLARSRKRLTTSKSCRTKEAVIQDLLACLAHTLCDRVQGLSPLDQVHDAQWHVDGVVGHEQANRRIRMGALHRRDARGEKHAAAIQESGHIVEPDFLEMQAGTQMLVDRDDRVVCRVEPVGKGDGIRFQVVKGHSVLLGEVMAAAHHHARRHRPQHIAFHLRPLEGAHRYQRIEAP